MSDLLDTQFPRTCASPARLNDDLLLGMPHLSATGLSENWLLKELGHRHWLMLARSAHKTTPTFRDEFGNPVYAAFCALSIEEADFGSVWENDVLSLSSSLSRLSRTQVSSRHHLKSNGRSIGIVTLISTFVRRSVAGSNHQIARVALDGLPPVDEAAPARQLSDLAAGFRSGRIEHHRGFDVSDGRQAVKAMSFDPCPSLDFNGAGFLYFASFIAMVDRAEWQFDREHADGAAPAAREVFFYANVDRNEAVIVQLMARHDMNEQRIGHHYRLLRSFDGTAVADVFSVKASLKKA